MSTPAEPVIEDARRPVAPSAPRPSRTRRSRDYVHGRIVGFRAGDLGNIPIIVGIILIAIYFQSRNSNFLTAGNFVNLIVQMAPIAVIGMGIVFVLLLGEIDLSVGFVSGVGGAICAVLLLPGGTERPPTCVAIVVALARRPRDRPRPGHAVREGRHPVVRRDPGRPARLERRRAADHRRRAARS